MNLTCGCGERFQVSDNMAGKHVTCPSCRGRLLASVAAGPLAPAGPASRDPAITISGGLLLKIIIPVVIVAGILAVYFGPVQVNSQFEAISPRMNDGIRDVVTRGLEYHTASIGFAAGMGGQPVGPPTIHTLTVLRPSMVMSMPQYIQFRGTSGNGEFTGRYDTKTDEVEADAEIGGFVDPGVDEAARHGKTKIKITGWHKGDEFVVKVNGKKADMADFPITPAPRRH